jgi:hypothetical protein
MSARAEAVAVGSSATAALSIVDAPAAVGADLVGAPTAAGGRYAASLLNNAISWSYDTWAAT